MCRHLASESRISKGSYELFGDRGHGGDIEECLSKFDLAIQMQELGTGHKGTG